jgi:hypothetical protein
MDSSLSSFIKKEYILEGAPLYRKSSPEAHGIIEIASWISDLIA